MTGVALSASLFCTLFVAGCSIKPQPVGLSEMAEFSSVIGADIDRGQEPLSGRVDLKEAVARAIKYNLDQQVERYEARFQNRKLQLAHFDMLPKLVVSEVYQGRDKYAGGQSREILSASRIGDLSLRSSTSSELATLSGDLELSWHILDFGLSYVRAQQAADRVMLAKESHRRVLHKIVQDVQVAYWRAVSAQRLRKRLVRLNGRVRQAIASRMRLVDQGDTPPLEELKGIRRLIEIEGRIQGFTRDLSVAKIQLAALMNVRPNEDFSLDVPHAINPPPFLGVEPDVLVDRALHDRSELRETFYRLRIDRKEAEAEVLGMLPGISLHGGPAWNSNNLLFNGDWVSWSAKVGWNLIKLAQLPQQRDVQKARKDLLRKQALSVAMAIMTQVHAAYARLTHARQRYSVARRSRALEKEIETRSFEAFKAGNIGEQVYIENELAALLAEIELDLAFIELASAYSNVRAVIGADIVDPELVGHLSVEELKDRLELIATGEQVATL